MKTKLKKFSINLIKIFARIIELITKKDFSEILNRILSEFSYEKKSILNKQIIFFVPNQFVKWRVKTFETKEPDTLNWINEFKDKEKSIFWDIGANIGLYSIYNVLKNNNSKTIAFEPSTSNLRVLSRNISINKLYEKIEIFPIPLSNIDNKFMLMREAQFIEGSGLNTYGSNFNFEGKEIKSSNDYKLIGTSINYLLTNKILEVPDYIKIDVDGNEHLILDGAKDFLKNDKIKSILIEVNEDFKEQNNSIVEILNKNNFVLSTKKRNLEIDNGLFENNFNYIFKKI